MNSVLWYGPHAACSAAHIPQEMYEDTRPTMEIRTQDHTIIRDFTGIVVVGTITGWVGIVCGYSDSSRVLVKTSFGVPSTDQKAY